MRQVCNIAYSTLAEGRDKIQMAELELALADPKDKPRLMAKKNQLAMQQLSQHMQPAGAPVLRPTQRTRTRSG